MAHQNLFRYGLGYYGDGCGSACGNLATSCPTDQYGSCAQPFGPQPQFAGLTYPGVPRMSLQPMSQAQISQWMMAKNAPNPKAGISLKQSPAEQAPRNPANVGVL